MSATFDPQVQPVRVKGGFGKRFLALLGLGMIGVIATIPLIVEQLNEMPPEMMPLPQSAMIAISLLNSVVLLAAAVAVGALLAHRVGLRSLVAERVTGGAAIWPGLRPHLLSAALLGLLFGAVVVGLDLLMIPWLGVDLSALTGQSDPVTLLVLGLLYGGITEELLLRWGVMSLLVWLGWRMGQKGEGLPHPALVWAAITLAAILFGLGHLPAAAALFDLTPMFILRTVLLNALGGLLFGWLFWRRGLEVAMIAHAATHVAFFILRLAGLMA